MTAILGSIATVCLLTFIFCVGMIVRDVLRKPKRSLMWSAYRRQK